MLNFRATDTNWSNIPEWINKKDDLSLMLWAGDCVHDGLTDVERLPDYDIYLCYGFDGLDANLNVKRARSICICVIDIHDEQQLSQFTNLFKGAFKTINSDYNGNTPRLPIKVYADLLKPGGSAYNTEGINFVFFPSVALRDTLELFAPVLPAALKPRRKWTKEMIQLAKDNGLSILATWTSSDLLIPYYDNIRAEQKRFDENMANSYPNQDLYSLDYTEETIETYWDTLPEHIFLTNIARAFIWEDIDATWVEPFKSRLVKYLERKVEMVMNEEDMQHFLAFYATRQCTETQLFALQIALKAIDLSKSTVLITAIRFYEDTRVKDKMVFGVIFSKI